MRAAAALLAATLVLVAVPAGADDWLRPGPAIPSAELTDQDGAPRSLRELIGDRPVIVSFFFTGCAAVCPMQTVALAQLQDAIDRRGLAGSDRPLILLIALDPFGDTPAAIRGYAGRFGVRLGDAAGWLMLTGSEAALAPVWQAFDQGAGDPADHVALFWIGRPGEERWTRAGITTGSDPLLEFLAGGTS